MNLAANQTLVEEALGEAGDHIGYARRSNSCLQTSWALRAEFNAAIVHARAAVEAAKRTNDTGLLAVTTAYFTVRRMFMTAAQSDLEAVRRGIEFEDSVRLLTGYRPSRDPGA